MSNCLLNCVMKIKLKQSKLVLIYLSSIIGFYFIIHTLSHVQNEKPRLRPSIYLWSDLAKSADNKCRLPLDIDPWDPSITQFLKRDGPRRFVCSHPTSEWTETDDKGVIRKICTNCLCQYWLFRRQKDSDNDIEYFDGGIIDDNGVDLKATNEEDLEENRFAHVVCYSEETDQEYKNNHYWFAPRKKTSGSLLDRIGLRISNKPSVLILAVESLSRLNYLRHMQLTREAFERLGNVFYLRGLNKMADNSFPNMIPFLTGHEVDHFGGPLAKGPFDDYPFIWKNFSDKGYQTALMEDEYEITLFNEWEVGRKGFVRQQPVDWYTFPFWKIIEKSDKRSYAKCYQDRRARIDIFLDQMKHFVTQCHTNAKPFFGFGFYIQATHVKFNNARTIDGHYSKFIDQLSNILKDNFVILMGDHGCRFEQQGFLYTTIGRIEERMPLFGIHIPDSILAVNPHLSHYLTENRDKLTNWLDIHRMLEDIITEDFSPITEKPNNNPKSYSLWRQIIPDSRSCSEALIPQMFCVCDQRKRLDVSDHKVKDVAQVMVNEINKILPIECHKLSLRVLINAEEITFSESIPRKSVPKVNRLYELTAELNPSSAIIRSQIHIFSNNSVKLDAEITRLNPYGHESHCVSDPLLKKICSCLKITIKLSDIDH